jgi:hypothetical protein
MLTQAHARFFVNNPQLVLPVYGSTAFIPDEHFFVTWLKKLNMPYDHGVTTYTDWSKQNTSKRGPRLFNELDPQVIEQARESGAWFMRKVSPTCQVDRDWLAY